MWPRSVCVHTARLWFPGVTHVRTDWWLADGDTQLQGGKSGAVMGNKRRKWISRYHRRLKLQFISAVFNQTHLVANLSTRQQWRCCWLVLKVLPPPWMMFPSINGLGFGWWLWCNGDKLLGNTELVIQSKCRLYMDKLRSGCPGGKYMSAINHHQGNKLPDDTLRGRRYCFFFLLQSIFRHYVSFSSPLSSLF